MLKVEIEINEEKVLAEDIYDLDDIYTAIDNAFADFGIIKLNKGIYRDNGSDKDFGNMWLVILALTETEWFIDNVSKLMWYNSDYGKDESDFSVEDVLKGLKDDGIKIHRAQGG